MKVSRVSGRGVGLLALAALVAVGMTGAGCGGGKKSSKASLATQWTPTAIQKPSATNTQIVRISASGLAVGTSDNRMVTWSLPNGFTTYGTLGGAASRGFDVGATGIAYGSADNGADTRAIQSNDSGILEINLGLAVGTNSAALAVNDAGNIAGVTWTGSTYSVWRSVAGTVTDITTLGGTGSISIQAINNAGVMTGVAPSTDGKNHAFRSVGNALVSIGSGPGSFAQGWDINTKGTVVGAYVFSGAQVPFVATANSIVPLPLPTGATEGVAFAINDNDDIVGCVTISGVNYAYLWRGGEGFDLNTKLRSALPSGAVLSVARDITNAGTIVSTMRVGGQDHSCLLSP